MLAASASPSTVAVALTFACCALVATAGAATTRVHRLPVTSDKPQAVLAQSAPAAKDKATKDKPGAKPEHKAANKPAVKGGKAQRRKQKPREPEMVDDPVLMHQARRSSPVKKATANVAAKQDARRERGPAAKAHSEVAEATASTSNRGDAGKLSVDDFVRAAGSPALDATDATDATDASSDAESPPQPPSPTKQKPAPVVLRAAPVLAQMKAADDAGPAPVESAQTVEGFGAEVETLTPHAGKVETGKNLSAAKHATAVADKEETPSADERRKITDAAMQPLAAPLYTRTGKLIVPLPLKGTREILVHQNQMADDAGLTRIQDDDDLDHMRAQHLLVTFPEVEGLEVNEELPMNRRYARPWTVKFVGDIARAYFARFHEPLRLNSAVRTVEYQLRLQRVNGNAAAVDGDTASPHLTGQAIDFGKHGMSVAEIAWMRAALLPLMQAGKIDVEEEFQQACFHISVYTSYAPKKRVAPKTELAQLHRE